MSNPVADPSAITTRRIRRSPSDLRAEALSAARRLIVEGHDQALTMRAVADATGVTYPNLSHHFGSAAGLHAAIAEDLVGELLAAIRLIGHQTKTSDHEFGVLVDKVFDLFQRDGLGRVFGWLVRSGDMARVEPIRVMLQDFIAERSREAGRANDRRFAEIALIISFAAYADSTIGPLLGQMFDFSDGERRAIVARLLEQVQRNARAIDGCVNKTIDGDINSE